MRSLTSPPYPLLPHQSLIHPHIYPIFPPQSLLHPHIYPILPPQSLLHPHIYPLLPPSPQLSIPSPQLLVLKLPFSSTTPPLSAPPRPRPPPAPLESKLCIAVYPVGENSVDISFTQSPFLNYSFLHNTPFSFLPWPPPLSSLSLRYTPSFLKPSPPSFLIPPSPSFLPYNHFSFLPSLYPLLLHSLFPILIP